MNQLLLLSALYSVSDQRNSVRFEISYLYS